MQSDALSDVLRVVRLSGGMFFRVRLRAPFAVWTLDSDTMRQTFAPDADHVLPFHLVTQGPIWVDVDGGEPVLLEKGDIIVFPRGTAHAVCDLPGQEPVPLRDLQDRVSGTPPVLRYGGTGPETRALCGFFRCQGRLFNPLLESLPRVMVIRQDPDRTPWLAATIERTFDETLETRPGGAALIERLTGLLFLEVVQSYAAQNERAGWLGALRDPVVGKALELIHTHPARPWTVEDFARRADVSRSVLAERFAELVGMPPIKYLASWRMELAAARLLDTRDSISDIAMDVGYETEAAFSKAFKRHVGEPPSRWRKARQIPG